MNKQFLLSTWRDIRQTPARFLALVSIIFLGVAFFVGIKATAPDMKQSADEYFRQTHLADVTLTNAEGVTQSQIDTIAKLNGVKEIDTQINADDTLTNNGDVVRLTGYQASAALNQLTLLEGRYPQAASEIILDQSIKSELNITIGDTIQLDESNQLRRLTYKVIGFIQSPVYLDKSNRGTSFIGSGSVAYYGFIMKDNFVQQLPTSLVIQLDASYTNYQTYSTAYQKKVTQFTSKLTSIVDQQTTVTTREDLSGYTEYKQNANRIDSLATVFPTIFFLIACLISFTTVRRMVDEKRSEVGLFYALGYRPTEIMSKFLLYIGSACLLGVGFGLVVGFTLFPKIIIEAYNQVYSIKGYQLIWHPNLIVLSTTVAILCTIGVAVGVLMLEVRQRPAELMRPKAPQAGRRILLERWQPFWRRLNFHYKVLFRNLFRYKGRMWMTIIGIASCTAMILTGFGLKDSIGDIVPLQFDKIWKYQLVVIVKQPDSTLADAFSKEVDTVVNVATSERTASKAGYQNQKVTVTVPKVNKELSEVQLLQSSTSEKIVAVPKSGALVSEKLASLYHLKVGDTLRVRLTDTHSSKVKIAGIIKNYVGHALFLSNAYYEELTGESPVYRTFLLSFQKDNQAASEAFVKKWQKDDNIITITQLDETKENLETSFAVLTIVVWILIIAAGMLAFIVLYNLNSMNIAERIRELSTMKVLGFFSKEVTLYVFRENIVLSLFGIMFGLFAGIFLHHFVIQTVEMDTTLFVQTMHWQSYLYAGSITFLFTLVVGVVMHHQLQKINMLDALKANE